MTFGQHEPACSLHNVAADGRREALCVGENTPDSKFSLATALKIKGRPIHNTQTSLLISPAIFPSFQGLMYESDGDMLRWPN